MKLKQYIIALSILYLLGLFSAFYISASPMDNTLDNIAINDMVYVIKSEWNRLGTPGGSLPEFPYGIDYVVLDREGSILGATRNGLSENENSAIQHRDTIITVLNTDGTVLGQILFYNDTVNQLDSYKHRLMIDILLIISLMVLALLAFLFLLYRNILKPFQVLKDFAQNIADGNLSLPLPMDKANLFGAFTESFDLMRSQLTIARENESKANKSKKELVASLSHDIKTPIASIKAVSELMYLKSEDPDTKEQLETINTKADQINLLISNMFHATLEELQELKVVPIEHSSRIFYELILNTDYRKFVKINEIPDCLILADQLRLTQVLDNIISNSYKYAGTDIYISSRVTDCFVMDIIDYGPGVPSQELPLLTQKYFRGTNASSQQGSGIGLYISKYFMEKMGGSLQCTQQNGNFTIRLTFILA